MNTGRIGIGWALLATMCSQALGVIPTGKIHPLLWEAGPGDRITAWVFFMDKDKPDADTALRSLEATYDARAIQRRFMRRTAPGLFDARDLPVSERYAGALAATGARIRVRSRWLNAVSVIASPEQLERIARDDFVRAIQPVLPLRALPIRRTTGVDVLEGPFYGFAEPQLAQIHLIELHDAGFTGEGVRVGVLDTGFRRTHAAFTHEDNPLTVVAEYDFVDDDADTAPETGDHPGQHEHGTMILGTLASYLPGVLVGGAFGASYILAKVESVEYENGSEEDLFVAGLEFIEANGGDVATSSVVIYDLYSQEQLDGMTSVMTIGFNTATENGVHCLQGAGNDGHDGDPATSHLLPPADAFDVNTIGAVTMSGATAAFSSDGPTADGRVKPEYLARGLATYTVDPNNDDDITTASGTSLATPVAAGAVACLAQAHPEWTVAQMREALTETADYFEANGTHDPLYIRGYGILHAFEASLQNPPSSADAPPQLEPRVLSVDRTPAGRGSAVLSFQLEEAETVLLRIFDVRGRVVATLADGPMPPGRHLIRWDGGDQKGLRVAAGLYLARIRAGSATGVARLILVH